MNRFLLIIWLLLYGSDSVRAQQTNVPVEDSIYRETLPDEPGASVSSMGLMPVDTVISSYPAFIEPDSVMQWKKRKEYAYMKNLDSLLRALQDQVKKESAKKSPSKKSFADNLLSTSFFSTLLILLALFFVAVILYHLMKSQAFFKRANVTMPAKEQQLEEDELLENDYDKLVNQAYRTADFRMGIRYLFLHTLQQLRDSNLIEYAIDKTNSRYAREIPAPLRNDFAKLVLAYEYVWYGNFSVTREQFDAIRQQYSTFFQKI